MRWLAAILILGSLAPSFARDVVGLFDEALAFPDPTRTEIYKSIGGTDLSLHIFEPDPAALDLDAAIIWIHGGGWEAGHPGQLFPHCAYFAKLGYLAISIEYRLAGEESTIFDCVEDARDAFYWVWQNAAALGIDPSRIIVGGESAGGHLAACVGYIEDPRPSGIPSPQPYPAASIPVNPITDLTTISWAMTKPGLTPADIVPAQSISPAFHVDAGDPPALLLHGDSDTVVPPEQSSDFASALHSVGQATNLRLWEGKSHAFFLYLPEFSLVDKPIIQLSLLDIEAFLQVEKLNGYQAVHGHFSPVHLFAGIDGFRSFSELIESGGQLFGSTYKGGPDDAGTVFRFDPATREHEVLHYFDGSDGREVFNGLATDGTTLFGVAKFGGTDDRGTLFKIDTDGSNFQILHHFSLAAGTGWAPHSAPVLIGDTLYGTTYHGGTTNYGGALYKFPLPAGPIVLMHSFDFTTGRHPTGQLLPIGNWLYGTASDLFRHDDGYYGSLYRIHRSSGTFELLHTFDNSTEGSHPYDDLYYDGSDKLIGTTLGKAFDPDSKGTIFSYSISSDSLTVIHDFGTSPGTGSKPNGALIAIDSSGFLYGHAHGSNGPGGDIGTLFRIKDDGSEFALLHRFEESLSGNTPMRSMIFHEGAFYGVTAFGGLTTDTSDPETGPGFIFKYEPLANPSDARVEYIDWLIYHGLLVNQSGDAKQDGDTLTLIEEFAFDGSPLELNYKQPLSFNLAGGPVAEFPKVRASMTPFIESVSSVDLQTWNPDTEHSLEMGDHPVEGSSYKIMTFTWPESVMEGDPIFIRFKTVLPPAVDAGVQSPTETHFNAATSRLARKRRSGKESKAF
jgi:uncharacterized repeat protein (TIGR03803 family)